MTPTLSLPKCKAAWFLLNPRRKRWLLITTAVMGEKIRIPLSDPGNLDATASEADASPVLAGIAFGSWAWQFYVILGRDGVARGGRGSIRCPLG